MIDVINLQRKVKLDTENFREFLHSLPEFVSEAEGKTFSVAVVSNRRMTELNKFFRGKDSTTDVLSFPHEPDRFETTSSPPYEGGVSSASDDGVVLSSPGTDRRERRRTTPASQSLGHHSFPKEGSLEFFGDIVISAEQAERQAKENKLSLENEIKQLILHGLLHLCGYDHETDNGEMNRRELALRKKLKID